MAHNPFSLEEAHEIAEDFEDLIDTDFNINKGLIYFVDNVLVCPFGENERNLFVSNYHFSKDKESSLDFYNGEGYDVIVLAYDVDDDKNYTAIDIRTFVQHHGITYNFPGDQDHDH